jgi:hypothetical protein
MLETAERSKEHTFFLSLGNHTKLVQVQLEARMRNSTMCSSMVCDLHRRVVLTNYSMHKTVYSFNGHIIYVQVHTNIYGTSKYETKSRSQRADVYAS